MCQWDNRGWVPSIFARFAQSSVLRQSGRWDIRIEIVSCSGHAECLIKTVGTFALRLACVVMVDIGTFLKFSGCLVRDMRMIYLVGSLAG